MKSLTHLMQSLQQTEPQSAMTSMPRTVGSQAPTSTAKPTKEKAPEPATRQEAREFHAQDPETYAYLDCAVRRACPQWLAHQVDDISQKAAIKVYKILNSADGPVQVSGSYLYRVASTVLVDEIRSSRRKIRQTSEFDDGRDLSSIDALGGQENPEHAVSSAELGNEILDCLSKLLRDRRMALTMKLQGYSYREAARMLGWGEKKTENLATRGRAELRICLRNKDLGVYA